MSWAGVTAALLFEGSHCLLNIQSIMYWSSVHHDFFILWILFLRAWINNWRNPWLFVWSITRDSGIISILLHLPCKINPAKTILCTMMMLPRRPSFFPPATPMMSTDLRITNYLGDHLLILNLLILLLWSFSPSLRCGVETARVIRIQWVVLVRCHHHPLADQVLVLFQELGPGEILRQTLLQDVSLHGHLHADLVEHIVLSIVGQNVGGCQNIWILGATQLLGVVGGSSVHHYILRFLFTIFSECRFISYRVFFVITHFRVALITFFFFFRNAHFESFRSLLVHCMLPTRAISRWMYIFIMMFIQIKLWHVYKLIFTRVRRRWVSVELMMTSFPHLVHFLNVWQILFLRVYVPHFIGDNQIIKYFSISPKFVFLNLKLILLNQFQDHFILFKFLLIP